MAEQETCTVPYCEHPMSEHDDDGCGVIVAESAWNAGVIACACMVKAPAPEAAGR